MIFLPSIAIISVSLAACLLLTVYVRRVLLRRAVLDVPNERSSHTVPTPRGGGWAIIAVLLPGMVLTGFFTETLDKYFYAIIAVAILAAISWIDDNKGLPARLRLSMHIFAACLGSMTFMGNETLFGGALPFWLDRVIMIVGWAWFMNLYNFMDGIDGITGVETISIATATCMVMTAASITAPFIDTLTLLLTGASLGFLALNWHPAKIFLGDIGSVPLGFLTGLALITLATHGLQIPALILPLYYLADSGITLARRAYRREKLSQAHRQHFYQYAARGLGRHDHVVYGIILCNISLLGSALLAVEKPAWGSVFAIVTVALLLRWMHKVGRN